MIKKKENIDEIAIIEEIFDKLAQDNKPGDFDYINWLEEYTTKKQMFNCESYEYETNPETRKNIFELSWFYDFIKKYAEDNFIKPSKFKYGTYYSIKHNNVGYNIGSEEIAFGSLVFCERTPILEDFIDYSDIINNIPQKNTEHIKKQLKELSDLIVRMVSENVPTDAISETTEKTLKKLLSNK